MENLSTHFMATDSFINIINFVVIAILTMILAYCALIQTKHVKRNADLMNLQRIEEELNKIILPLRKRIDDRYYFNEGFHSTEKNPHRQFYDFWDNILYYSYLTPDYLAEAIDNYYKSKDNTSPWNAFRFHETEENKEMKRKYEIAENELREALEKRFEEINERQKQLITDLSL